ncbi:MAG TPA: HlyD family secretion protein [Bryobacteraceae bacterium]|jgi:membrane fusion protein (multidrug efflux system)
MAEQTQAPPDPASKAQEREHVHATPAVEPPDRGFLRTHPIKAGIGFLVLAGMIVGGFLFWRYSQTFEDTDDAFIDGHTNYISPRISGTITNVTVVENQFVKAGDVLAEIDPSDYQVAYERAQADLAQAQAQIRSQSPAVPITVTTNESSITSTQADINNAQAAIASAERDRDADLARLREAQANAVKAESDLNRYKSLVAKEEVSREDYDQKVAAAEAAAAQVQSIRAMGESAAKIIDQRQAALDAVKVKLQQVRSNAPQELEIRRAAIQSAQANAQAAKAQVDQALLNLKYTKIIAPVSGVIGRKQLEVGMRVQPGQQLLVIVPLDDIWVTANFKESQIRRMHPGQSVKIHVDAFDKDFDGYVESLPAATGAKFSVLPPENATGNFVKVVQRLPVRIRFKSGQDPEQRLRPGMSVEPKVFL